MNLKFSDKYEKAGNCVCINELFTAKQAVYSHFHSTLVFPDGTKVIRPYYIESICLTDNSYWDGTQIEFLLWLEKTNWDLSDIIFHIEATNPFKVWKMKRIIKRNGWNLVED